MGHTVSEISVSIRDEEKTLRKKFLVYDAFQANLDDKVIKDCIHETLKYFSSEPVIDCKITVKITLRTE